MIVSSRRAVQYNLLAIRFLAIAVRDTWDRVCVFTLGATRPRLGRGYDSGVLEFLQGDDLRMMM
jgi:hypothetical protein